MQKQIWSLINRILRDWLTCSLDFLQKYRAKQGDSKRIATADAGSVKTEQKENGTGFYLEVNILFAHTQSSQISLRRSKIRFLDLLWYSRQVTKQSQTSWMENWQIGSWHLLRMRIWELHKQAAKPWSPLPLMKVVSFHRHPSISNEAWHQVYCDLIEHRQPYIESKMHQKTLAKPLWIFIVYAK